MRQFSTVRNDQELKGVAKTPAVANKNSRNVSLTVFIPEPLNKRLLTRDRVEDKPEDVAIKKPAVLLQRVGRFKPDTGVKPVKDQKLWNKPIATVLDFSVAELEETLSVVSP